MKKTALVLAAAGAMVALGALAQEAGSSAKGIFRDPATVKNCNGIAYRILLARGGERREVPVWHAFHSGDRFRLQLKLKDAAYVYVLNRTFDGDPKALGEKGITVVRTEDREHGDHARSYTQLFPAPGERAERIPAGHFRDIPGDVLLRMDQHPGLEKLYVIISDHELDFQRTYGGALHNGGGSEYGALDRLDKDLTDWSAGTQTEAPPAGADDSAQKGIERDSYAVGSRSNPIVVEVTLHHYGE